MFKEGKRLWGSPPSEENTMRHDAVVCGLAKRAAKLGVHIHQNTAVMEKITSLGMTPRDNQPPFILQGPVLQITCQILVMAENIVLLAFSRGYAQSMSEAILQSGSPWN